MKKNAFTSVLIPIIFAVLAVGCDETASETGEPHIPPVIHFSSSEYNMMLGDSMRISYVVTAGQVALSDLIWTSSDPEVASVSNTGLVTAKKIGGISITLSSRSQNINASVSVRVRPVSLSNIEIANGDSLIVAVIGEPQQLGVTYIPENATDKHLFWRSSNTELLTVTEDGTITVKKHGNVFVEASRDGARIYDAVTIVPGTRERGFAVTYVQLYEPDTDKYYFHLNCGGITGAVTIHKAWLYTTHGNSFALKEQIVFEELNVTIPQNKAMLIWRKEISSALSNTLGYSVIEIEYTINSASRQRLFVTR